jgi:hypothetical protein
MRAVDGQQTTTRVPGSASVVSLGLQLLAQQLDDGETESARRSEVSSPTPSSVISIRKSPFWRVMPTKIRPCGRAAFRREAVAQGVGEQLADHQGQGRGLGGGDVDALQIQLTLMSSRCAEPIMSLTRSRTKAETSKRSTSSLWNRRRWTVAMALTRSSMPRRLALTAGSVTRRFCSSSRD